MTAMVDATERNSEKLDKIGDDLAEVRVSMATMSGDVRAVLGRIDAHDKTSIDVESRLRALERRSYAIPGLGAILGLLGLVVAVWGAVRR